MRFIILLILFGCKSSYQPFTYPFLENEPVEEFPFQVLYSNGAEVNDSALLNFDFISSDDSVRIRDDHIILVHYTGEFIDISNDTTVLASDLGKSFTKRNISSSFNRLENQRPNIKHLYDSIRSDFPYISDYQSFKILSPYGSNKIGVNQKQCILWVDNKPNFDNDRYRVSVYSLYEEELEAFYVEKNSFEFEPDKYYNNSVSDNLIIVKIRNADGKTVECSFLIQSEDNKQLHNLCSISSEALALQIAYELEMAHDFEASYLMWKLAAILSKQHVYDALLKNFMLRNKGSKKRG